jgi:hypothetical protein
MTFSQYVCSPPKLLESKSKEIKFPLKKSQTYNYEHQKMQPKNRKVIKYSLKAFNSPETQTRERKNHMKSVEIVSRVKKLHKSVYKNESIQNWPSWNYNNSQTESKIFNREI